MKKTKIEAPRAKSPRNLRPGFGEAEIRRSENTSLHPRVKNPRASRRRTKVAQPKDDQKIIKEESEVLLRQLGIEGDCEVFLNEDGAEVILNTSDTGIVIGYHGETLEALQLILSLVVSKKIGRFIRVSVDIGDYKKNRADFLQNLTLQTKARVLQENQELSLPNLKSWERRIVHMFLQDDEEVTSESIGEGRERTLVIKPRAKQSD